MAEDFIRSLAAGAARSPQGGAAQDGEPWPAAAGLESLLEALAETTRHVLAAPDSAAVAEASLARLGVALGASRIAVVLELRDGQARASDYQVMHEWVRPGSVGYAEAGLARLPAPQAVLFASICSTGIGFQGSVDEVPQAQREILLALGTGAIACAPFVVGEHYAGLLTIEDDRRERLWSRAEIDALTIAAQTFGAVRQRARIDQRLLAERARAVELARANEALRRSVERVSQDLRVESLTGAFLAEVVQVLGAQGGCVILRVPGRPNVFMPQAAYQQDRLLRPEEIASDPFLGNFVELTADDPECVFAGLAAGEAPTMSIEVLRDAMPLAYAYHEALGHRQLWHIPLRLGGELLGFTGLALAQAGPPGQSARDLATALAQQFALALELTRLAEESRQLAVARERELAAADRLSRLELANELLREGVSALASDRRIPALVEAIMAAAERQTGAAASMLFVYKRDHAALRLVASRLDGNYTGCVEAAGRTGFAEFTAPADLPAWQHLLEHRTILIHGVESGGYAAAETLQLQSALGHRALGWVPVGAGDSLLGMVGLAWREPDAGLTAEQSSLVATLAQQLALTLELMHLAEEAKTAAVAREQQRSVQSRAAELARANRILQESAARLAGATDVRSIAAIFMTEALRASDASAAALFLERAGGFELVMIAQDGVFEEGEALASMPCTAAVHLASRDPASPHFTQLRAGEARWRFVDAPDTEWVGEALAYHREQGHLAVWDIPFSVEGRVIGYLALAFRGMDTPLAIVTETVGTLANQISVGLGLTTIAARLRASEVREAVSVERSRLARDIHDSLAQSFSSIAMQTEALLAHAGDGERLRRTLGRIAETARHGIGEARATALALLPLENRIGALDQALEGLASRCTIQDGVACSFVMHGVPTLLPLAVQEASLRIAQEAINNALRHSGGTRVEVTVHYLEDRILLTVRDDGSGVRADGQAISGMGLKGMQQRAHELGGSFRVLSVSPHGTCIEVNLPTAGAGP